jgi:hypothetical protein
VDLRPGSQLKRAEQEVTSKGPMPVVGPAGYAWADQRAKELARNTKPHYQHGPVKPPSGSLFADPYTRTGHDQKRKSTEKQVLIKQWAHVDTRDSFENRDQRTFNSGLLVQVNVCKCVPVGPNTWLSNFEVYGVPFHLVISLIFLVVLSYNSLFILELLFQNFEDRSDQMEYSGPILSQSQLVDDFLTKHEKHIRSAVRRSWFQKGTKLSQKYSRT